MFHHLEYLLLLVSVLAALDFTECTPDQQPIPTFPYLFNNSKIKELKLRILSETYSTDGNYHTQEEFLDLRESKSSIVKLNQDGEQVRFLDARRGLSFEYEPYQCRVKAISEIPQGSSAREWNYKFTRQLRNDPPLGSNSISNDDYNGQGRFESQEVEMRLFGVAGLWLFAERQIKTFAMSKFIYSSSKDVSRESFSWTAVDKVNNISIVFYFVDHAPNTLVGLSPELSLELIEIWSLSDQDSLLRTINVLEMEYSLDDESYERFLEVPIGYGCYEQEDTNDTNDQERDNVIKEEDSARDSNWDKMVYKSPGVFDLEITATTFAGPTSRLNPRQSDTVSVQIAYSMIRNKTVNQLRVRSTESDIKTVFNHPFNVKYIIDLRRGNCSLEHLPAKELVKGRIEFANNLSLELFGESHSVLFDSSSNRFRFVKTTEKTLARPELHFFETSDSYIWKFERPTRIIRTYEKTNDFDLNLVAITIWVLDEKRRSIVESYHINVIDYRPLAGWPDQPRLFDVSDECFLNDASKRSGRDYAWIELTYPQSGHDLKFIASNENHFKRMVYTNFLDASRSRYLDFLRVPRIELELEDEALVLRLLLLDLPPLELFFDRIDDMQLKPSASGWNENYAPDVAHCGLLCRLNHCTQMSFCPANFRCLLRSSLPVSGEGSGANNSWQMITAPGCTAYSWPNMPTDETSPGPTDKLILEQMRLFHEHSLHAIVARFQQQNFDQISVPDIPDELKYSSDIYDSNYEKLLDNYGREWKDSLTDDNDLAELSFWTRINGHVIALVPSKFALENDPLSSFGLGDRETDVSDDYFDNFDSISAAFHEGSPATRYKNVVQVGASGSLKEQANLRQFQGLSYDQCALACMDGRCGSFSYCHHRQECILSNVSSVSQAMTLQMTEMDPECAVAIRDFLGNYIKFSNSMRPQTYLKTSSAVHPSDCALICESETAFRCRAFDFCVSETGPGAQLTCMYHTSHLSSGQVPNGSRSNGSSSTGCDHYSRSSEAEFTRLEYRKFAQQGLVKLKTTTFEGHMVGRCAEICANELADCLAFQFCFEPAAQGAKRQCIMVQGERRVANSSSSAAGDGEQREFDASADLDGDASVELGQKLEFSSNCQLFSRRRDTEIHLSHLAIGAGPRQARQHQDETSAEADWSLALGCLAVSLVSALVGLGLYISGEHNELVRIKLEQMGVRFGGAA